MPSALGSTTLTTCRSRRRLAAAHGGALFGRRQAEESGVSRGLAELMKREGSGIPGELKQMTEEERVVDEKRKAERKAEMHAHADEYRQRWTYMREALMQATLGAPGAAGGNAKAD